LCSAHFATHARMLDLSRPDLLLQIRHLSTAGTMRGEISQLLFELFLFLEQRLHVTTPTVRACRTAQVVQQRAFAARVT
jgi:hypothetical protein